MIVGVDINSKNAVVSVVDDGGAPTDALPPRFEPSADTDPGKRLNEYAERIWQHLRGVAARELVIVRTSERQSSPSTVRETAQLEAAVAMAAAKANIPVHTIHQKSVGSHLGLGGNAGKADIRKAIEARLGAAAVSPDPERRARAVGAAIAVVEGAR